MVIVILAVLGAAVIFAAGYVAGSGGFGSADLTVSTDAGGPGTPCDVLCRKWKQRRAEACSALMASDMAAKAQAAANQADRAKVLAAAKAAPQGDDLVLVGEMMIGEGKAKDAIPVIQEGLKKPLKDASNGQIRLGQAYLAAGQKADAKAAFAKVKTPEKDAMIAHLWSLAASR